MRSSAFHPSLPRSSARPLLALRDALVEWHVGLGSQCAATVRVLDHVHFAVAPGQCILVHHNDPAGVSVLLAALSGDRRLRPPAVRCTHLARAGVRIRRTSIRADLIPTLLNAWEMDPLPASRVITTPAVHLLRASRPSVSASQDHAAWTQWAQIERARGGAVVIVTDQELAPHPDTRSARHSHVNEAMPVYLGAAGLTADAESAVQAWRLRHGRLAPAIRLRGSQ